MLLEAFLAAMCHTTQRGLPVGLEMCSRDVELRPVMTTQRVPSSGNKGVEKGIRSAKLAWCGVVAQRRYVGTYTHILHHLRNGDAWSPHEDRWDVYQKRLYPHPSL
jgi:hypothetical protein